ncbi:hypothetical protein KBY27_17985 [Ruegeria pomeroyi]|uniref:PA14 domain-containing protein n=1 Tax=Ruegeria pomeroyi TaxID=89184 RepID=A0A9Q3WP27_9RHOB|nr:hypothetical protein [Ruegeria pomeroyi]MCE8539350.1 hypothetical protein [Ruegeria pomeroyi]
MRVIRTAALAASALLVAVAAQAAPLKLQPAKPLSANLKPGLSVRYAWGGPPLAKIDNLTEARDLLALEAKPGKPLRGLDYADRSEFEPTLTHKEHYNVAADIRGYMKFEEPGIYEIETWSNDGIDARLSGQQVGLWLTRQSCSANQRVEVEVPEPGWYKLEITYFQKYMNKCLMMKWGKKGSGMNWVPNSAFGR